MTQAFESTPAADRWWWLAAMVTSLGLALLATAPVWQAPGQGMLCGVMHPDCAGNQWLLVWVAERVVGLEGLLHNSRYYWPVGDAPFLAGNGGEGLLYLPFHLAFGWPVGANVFLVLVLVGNGLAACWMARGAGASWPGALLAGIWLGPSSRQEWPSSAEQACQNRPQLVRSSIHRRPSVNSVMAASHTPP